MLTSQEILRLSHPIEYKSDFIEFFCDNPFTDCFLLQITWNKYKAVWYRQTLIKKEPNYTVCQEAGEMPLSLLIPIVRQAQQKALPAQFYCALAGRDGHHYRLVIGDDFTNLAYEWYEVFAPDAWEQAGLNKLAHDLQALQASWVGEKKSHVRLGYAEESTEKGFMSLLNWQEI
jgi:hypothetical protein